ncbi:MAG: hypothetical protein AAF574_13820, partial [Pseudomonadota bacterium]
PPAAPLHRENPPIGNCAGTSKTCWLVQPQDFERGSLSVQTLIVPAGQASGNVTTVCCGGSKGTAPRPVLSTAQPLMTQAPRTKPPQRFRILIIFITITD